MDREAIETLTSTAWNSETKRLRNSESCKIFRTVGSIRERKFKSGRVAYEYEISETINGKRHRQYVGSYRTRREALEIQALYSERR